VRQQIRFCTASDGVRIAYAVHGSGPPLVRAATWLTHVQHDWDSPLIQHWLRGLAERRTVVRYDMRGCGLSDREVADVSLEAHVRDLEAVADHAGYERFALLGLSQGGPVSILYARRHPERVTRLVLNGTYARGRRRRGSAHAERTANLLTEIISEGWADNNRAFRHVFTDLLAPGASEQQAAWFDELQRLSSSAETAVRVRRALDQIDVSEDARQLAVPTLIMHTRGDAIVPFEEGRHLAGLIPGAEFVSLPGHNHILLEGDEGWRQFREGLNRFLGMEPVEPVPGSEDPRLSRREREVLQLVADGRANEEIAERLHLSIRTVERHLANVYSKLQLSGKAARAAAAAHYSRSRR
jgi:pimeloyl-ACP methyl ester carboxylesterase/DNA-binding CsgD family transcriptional regulator